MRVSVFAKGFGKVLRADAPGWAGFNRKLRTDHKGKD